MFTTTITNLPNATVPLSGAERVPMDQAGVTVDAPVSAIAALSDPAGTAAAAVEAAAENYDAAGTATAAVAAAAGNYATAAQGALAASAVQPADLPAGDLVSTTETQTLTNKTLGNLKETVHAITDAAGFVIDPNNGPMQVVTLGANRTPVVANFAAGQSVTVFIDDGAGYAVTWTSVGTFLGGTTAPQLVSTGYNMFQLFKLNSIVNIMQLPGTAL